MRIKLLRDVGSLKAGSEHELINGMVSTPKGRTPIHKGQYEVLPVLRAIAPAFGETDVPSGTEDDDGEWTPDTRVERDIDSDDAPVLDEDETEPEAEVEAEQEEEE